MEIGNYCTKNGINKTENKMIQSGEHINNVMIHKWNVKVTIIEYE